MKWAKEHWLPLAAGFAAGYFVARSGGLPGAVAKAKATGKGAV
jgi:hypothetical protein